MALKSPKFLKLLFFLLFWASPALLQAVTPPIPAHPAQYVVDLAGVLDAGTQAKLNAMLKDLENKTTAQVVVLTLNSLEGEPIDSFSHQTAVKWGIGQKGKDNGVLITVAVKDKKYRFEVGYGLESTLPDSLVGSIGRQYLVPNFKKGDFAGGIVAAVTEINKLIDNKGGAVTGDGGNPDASPSTTVTPSQTSQTEKPKQLTLVLLIAFIILALPALALIVPRLLGGKRRGGGGFWFGGFGGGGWSSGGGDSGGFSGGGGDFGGGGASGDW